MDHVWKIQKDDPKELILAIPKEHLSLPVIERSMHHVIGASIGETVSLSRLFEFTQSVVFTEPVPSTINSLTTDAQTLLQDVSPWEDLCEDNTVIIQIKDLRKGVHLPDPRFGMKIENTPDGPIMRIVQHSSYRNADRNTQDTIRSSLRLFSDTSLYSMSAGPDTVEIIDGKTEISKFHRFDREQSHIEILIQPGITMNIYNEYDSLANLRRRVLEAKFDMIDGELIMMLNKGMEPDEIKEAREGNICLPPYGMKAWDAEVAKNAEEQDQLKILKKVREEEKNKRLQEYEVFFR